MSSKCSNCDGTGSILATRVPDPSKHLSAGMGRVRCTVCGGVGTVGMDAENIRATVSAGETLGMALASAVIWLLNNRFLSFLWFYVGFAATGLFVGLMIWDSIEGLPKWYQLSISYLPFLFMIIFRKKMIGLGKKMLLLCILTGLVLSGISLVTS